MPLLLCLWFIALAAQSQLKKFTWMVEDYVGRLDDLVSTSVDSPAPDGIFGMGLSIGDDVEGMGLLDLTASDNAMVSKVVLALSVLTREMDYLCRYNYTYSCGSSQGIRTDFSLSTVQCKPCSEITRFYI